MADVQLDDLRQRRDGLGAGVIEPVAGMDFETETVGQQRAGVRQQRAFRLAGAFHLPQRVAAMLHRLGARR